MSAMDRPDLSLAILERLAVDAEERRGAHRIVNEAFLRAWESLPPSVRFRITDGGQRTISVILKGRREGQEFYSELTINSFGMIDGDK